MMRSGKIISCIIKNIANTNSGFSCHNQEVTRQKIDASAEIFSLRIISSI